MSNHSRPVVTMSVEKRGPVDATKTVKCEKCGAEIRIGDWPMDCHGDPDAHKRG